MTVRIVVADDHGIVREGLGALLSAHHGYELVGTAATGAEAVRAAVTLRPDVLVMDIQMPDLTGIEATREIAKVAPEVAVLMLTMFDDDESVFAAMRAGARGYVLKGAAPDNVIRAIAAVSAGEAIFGPGIARRALVLSVRAAAGPACFPRAHAARTRGPRPDRRRVSATPPSQPASAWPRRPSATTSPASSPNSRSPAAPKPSSKPAPPASASPDLPLRSVGLGER